MSLKEALAAVKEMPDDVDGWVTLARELRSVGLHQESRESYERALQLDPAREELFEELWALESSETLPVWLHELEQLAEREKEGELGTALVQRAQQRERPVQIATGAALVGIIVILVTVGLFIVYTSAPSPTISAAEGSAPPSSSASGQTRADAVPVGESLLLGDGLQITVLNVLEDPDALSIRFLYDFDGDGETEWRDAPPNGMHPYVVRLMVENVRGEESQYLSFYDMAVVSNDQVAYDDDCGITPEELGGVGLSRLPRGERTEGNLCFLVADDAEIEYVLYDSSRGTQRRYFRVND